MTKVLVKVKLASPTFSLSNKVFRVVWSVVYLVLFRFSPVSLFSYRACLLRLFGAKIGKGAHIYSSVKIWLPANLKVGHGSAIGPDVKLYNQGTISVGSNAIISQGAHLCASTHNYNDPLHPLVVSPIKVGDSVWVCADAFIGPGVDLGEGCVVGARAVVTKSVDAWSVVAGNPAKFIKLRESF